MYLLHTTFKKYPTIRRARGLRGNDVVFEAFEKVIYTIVRWKKLRIMRILCLKFHQEFHQVFVVFQFKLLTQPVTPDLDTTERDIEQ